VPVVKIFLHVQERPHQQSPVLYSFEVLFHQRVQYVFVHVLENLRILAHQCSAHVLHALPLEPRGVGGGEALFLRGRDPVGDVALHHSAEQVLAVVGLLEVLVLLVSRLVLVDADDVVEVAELHSDGEPHCEVDEVVVQEGDARLQCVGAGELVLDDEETVKECLGLEVE